MEPMDHIGLAMKLIRERRPTITYEEQLSIAWEALTATADKFDEKKGSFGSLLRWYVMSTIQKRAAQEMEIVKQPEKRRRTDGHFMYVQDFGEMRTEYTIPKRDEYDLMWKTASRVLNPREIQIIHCYYMLEWGYKEIGLVFAISKQRAQQIVARALEKLREVMDDPDAR